MAIHAPLSVPEMMSGRGPAHIVLRTTGQPMRAMRSWLGVRSAEAAPALEAVVQDQPDHPGADLERGHARPGDLGLADARPVVDGHLHDAQAVQERQYHHL